jgi:4-hydroxythreonine-4-phosphate dehydrogenase
MSFIKKNLDSAIALHGIDNLDQIIPAKSIQPLKETI